MINILIQNDYRAAKQNFANGNKLGSYLILN